MENLKNFTKKEWLFPCRRRGVEFFQGWRVRLEQDLGRGEVILHIKHAAKIATHLRREGGTKNLQQPREGFRQNSTPPPIWKF